MVISAWFMALWNYQVGIISLRMHMFSVLSHSLSSPLSCIIRVTLAAWTGSQPPTSDPVLSFLILSRPTDRVKQHVLRTTKEGSLQIKPIHALNCGQQTKRTPTRHRCCGACCGCQGRRPKRTRPTRPARPLHPVFAYAAAMSHSAAACLFAGIPKLGNTSDGGCGTKHGPETPGRSWPETGQVPWGPRQDIRHTVGSVEHRKPNRV
jgi:hypothetical protein